MDEITKAVCQQVERELTKAFNKGKSKSTELTGYSGNNMSSWTHVSNVWDSNSNVPASYGFNIIAGNTESRLDFIPTKVIYSCPATICFFPDGSKVIVKCGKHEEYDKEAGVMALAVTPGAVLDFLPVQAGRA